MKNAIPWLIGFACIALALGPILMLRLSPKQKREANLRALAQKKGLMVRMDNVSFGAEERAFCFYTLPWARLVAKNPSVAPATLSLQRIAHDAHFDGFWDWQGLPPTFSKSILHNIKVLMQTRPAGIFQIRFAREGLGAAWDERVQGGDDEEALKGLYDWLSALGKAVLGESSSGLN